MEHKPTVRLMMRPCHTQDAANRLAEYDWEDKTPEEVAADIWDYVMTEGLHDFFTLEVTVEK